MTPWTLTIWTALLSFSLWCCQEVSANLYSDRTNWDDSLSTNRNNTLVSKLSTWKEPPLRVSVKTGFIWRDRNKFILLLVWRHFSQIIDSLASHSSIMCSCKPGVESTASPSGPAWVHAGWSVFVIHAVTTKMARNRFPGKPAKITLPKRQRVISKKFALNKENLVLNENVSRGINCFYAMIGDSDEVRFILLKKYLKWLIDKRC